MESRPPSSRKLIAISLVLAVVIAVPVLFLVMRPKRTVDRETAFAQQIMISDLRGLIQAEEGTRRVVGRYLADAERTGHLSSVGVNPPVITLADTGWSAIVTHKVIPSARCAVGVHVRNPLKRFARSGEIVCEP